MSAEKIKYQNKGALAHPRYCTKANEFGSSYKCKKEKCTYLHTKTGYETTKYQPKMPDDISNDVKLKVSINESKNGLLLNETQFALREQGVYIRFYNKCYCYSESRKPANCKLTHHSGFLRVLNQIGDISKHANTIECSHCKNTDSRCNCLYKAALVHTKNQTYNFQMQKNHKCTIQICLNIPIREILSQLINLRH